MNNKHYILNDKHEIIEVDFMTWGRFFNYAENRRVALDEVNGKKISTVFLGIDHNFEEGEPLLFETMVFGKDEEDCERYSTWKEAEEGHKKMVEKYKLKNTI